MTERPNFKEEMKAMPFCVYDDLRKCNFDLRKETLEPKKCLMCTLSSMHTNALDERFYGVGYDTRVLLEILKKLDVIPEHKIIGENKK
jgi:hypothetical protein